MDMDIVDNMDFVDSANIADRIVKRSTLSMLSILSTMSMPTIAPTTLQVRRRSGSWCRVLMADS